MYQVNFVFNINQNIKNAEKRFQNLCNEIGEISNRKNVWCNNIDRIIITDNYEQTVEDISKEFNIQETKILKDKELISGAKTLTNNQTGKYTLIVNANFSINEAYIQSKKIKQIIFSQICYLMIEDMFSKKFIFQNVNTIVDENLKNILKILIIHVCSTVIYKNLEIGFFSDDEYSLESNIHTFKRKVKDFHLQYQKKAKINDDPVELFNNILDQLHLLLNSCAEPIVREFSLDELGQFKIPILNIIHLILESKVMDGEEINILNFKIFFMEIMKLCYISIPTENPLEIRIIDNPKKLFRKEIIETELSIVAFIDILGFKELISDYDNDPYSNTLKNLHIALNDSIKISVDKLKSSNEYYAELLDFRLFSDCLCLSLPLFDTDEDFHFCFFTIALASITYQYLMMYYGYFVRGGISIGSHYSDKNMIFSGGLAPISQESRH